MQEFILSYDNLPYLACVVVIAVLGFIELMGRMAGVSFIAMVDLPTNNSVSRESASNSLSSWLCLNRMSVLLWCVMALSLFAVLGFSTNWLLWVTEFNTLPQSISVWIIFPLTGLACHWLGRQPWWNADNQAEQVEELDFSGSIAITTMGDACQGLLAEALVRDEQNQPHYVMVEPLAGERGFTPGMSVVLLSRRDNIWLATRSEP